MASFAALIGARRSLTLRAAAAMLAFGVLNVGVLSAASCARRSTLPDALSDREFWQLSERLSEPPGTFPLSDNLVSNEPYFAEVIRALPSRGGVYVGVGPEQNFSYIAKLRPAMAFIVDIRNENRDLHLMYKALFELATDRSDFVARLFSRPRPAGLGSGSSIQEIFDAFARVPPAPTLFDDTIARIHHRLLVVRQLPLSSKDLEWIDQALRAFLTDGPAIHFWGSRAGDTRRPSYRALMTAKDVTGQSRSYLATEANFEFVKRLQSRNRVVPVVGDFGGPSALRRIGDFVREHDAVIQAFYGSNVAVYLTRDQMQRFCTNLAALPASSQASFIDGRTARVLASRVSSCQAGQSLAMPRDATTAR